MTRKFLKVALFASTVAITSALALFSTEALADHVLIGTLVSPAGATINNTTTATPFPISPLTKIDVQCTGTTGVRFATGTSGGLAATATSFLGISDPSRDVYSLDPRKGFTIVAMIPNTAVATTCYVYSVVTQ